MGGKVREGRHGGAAAEPRREAEPARRSSVGYAAGLGDPPWARSCCGIVKAAWGRVIHCFPTVPISRLLKNVELLGSRPHRAASGGRTRVTAAVPIISARWVPDVAEACGYHSPPGNE